MSIDLAELYSRFLSMRFPALGKSIGNFPLYDGIVAGAISSYLQGADVHPADIEPPDHQTLDEITALFSKSELSDDEKYFLEYWRTLEELRLRVRNELVQSRPE
jgi:hypothetical protein